MVAKTSNNHQFRATQYAVMIAVVLTVAFVSYQLSLRVGTFTNQEASAQTDQGGAAVVSPPYKLPDFTLISHTGEPVSLSDFRGRSVVMFFGYTHCPDVCPTTLADYMRVKESLGKQADDVAFVFVSVDSQRDTPDVLASYLAQFDTDFIGLTGDEETLRSLGTDYGLSFGETRLDVGHSHESNADDHHHHDDEAYFVEHTSPSFLVDSEGYLRLVYFYGTKPEVIAHGIEQTLEEKTS